MNDDSRRIILIAYDLNPMLGSECGKASAWLKIISKRYLVEVFVDAVHKDDIISDNYQNVSFHFIRVNKLLRKWFGRLGAYNILNQIFISRVKREIRKLDIRRFSLLHCITPSGIHSYNDLYTIGLPVLIGPLGGNLPTPVGFENIFSDDLFREWLRKWAYNLIKKNKKMSKYFLKAKKIIIGTKYVLNNLPEAAKSKSTIIFDTLVDTNYYLPNPQKSFGGIVKILFVGRLENSKGVILLIDAVNLCIQKNITKFLVEIAGKGTLEKKINNLINKHNLGAYIKLVGELSKQELLKKYQNSDLFCLPTLREPGGGAILEAMACGLPVITSDYGGPAFSVTTDCGFKIEVKNYEQYVADLAKAIEILVLDESLRKQMGLKARERAVQQFSLEAQRKQILDVYDEVLHENK